MRQVLIAFGLLASASLASPAQAQSPFGFVGSANNAPYLGYVGGGGGPYTPNYGQFIVGARQPRVIVVHHRAPTIVNVVITGRQRPRAERRCGPVLLSLPDAKRFEPFGACPAPANATLALARRPGAKIIRIQ